MADIRFQLDEHIEAAVAIQLLQRGVDVLTADDAGLRRAPDTAHFSHSRKTGRVIVTYDHHFAGMHQRGVEHAGIVYFPKGRRSVGEIVEALVLVHGVYTPEEMINRIEFF
ncbi:MAG TPA: DUF5615 family PIN-like protein [Thermomicrobiales bacterium]|nr:DUF5615 family PIN-like protein [Thermomicrobiales bacterium]